MTVDRHELYMDRSGSEAPAGGLRRLLAELAPHDWLVLGYLTLLNLVVLGAPPSTGRSTSLVNVVLTLATYVLVTGLVRGRVLTHPFAAPLLYRLATYGCVQVTYFMFADLLPAVNARSLDHQLLALDMKLFGFEPAIFFDRFVTPATTEWFAFFYFGYFFVLALHVLPILFLCRKDRLLGEFALGMLLIFCIGHTLYMVVPGYGPYKAMPEVFQNELPPGVWWNMTAELVAQSGAQKDIFPSLHTAAPTFILLFSFHHRRRYPFRYSWPVVGVFVVNIIIATMFLRWHYVIDVVAGMLLALTAHVLSVRFTHREFERRAALGLSALWPRWFEPVQAGGEAAQRPLPTPGE